MKGYPVERMMRDAGMIRIFDVSNRVQRLLQPGTCYKEENMRRMRIYGIYGYL